jgi:hypothetical protein
VLKMLADFLIALESPLLETLPAQLGVAPFVALVFYHVPGLSNTEITRDPAPFVCGMLRILTLLCRKVRIWSPHSTLPIP